MRTLALITIAVQLIVVTHAACETETKLTWIELSDATCADGSPAGYFLDVQENSENALVYLGDGAICGSEEECTGRLIKVHMYACTLVDSYARMHVF